MTNPVGEGFIIIRADLSRFGDELRRGVNRALDEVADDFLMFERFVAGVFEDLADDMIFHMRHADRVISRIFADLARDARSCAFEIASAFALASRMAREDLDDLQDRAERAFRNIRRAARGSAFSITDIFRNMGTRLFSIFSGLFSSSGGAGGGAGGAASAGGSILSSLSGIGGQIGGILQMAAMAAIIPLLVQIVGVVINLAGALFALPAAAGVAIAAFVPLTIAFKGFGEALAAVWEGDPDKMAEALKNLAPHARAVLREFSLFVPQLKAIGKSIQQGFFIMLDGSVTRLMNNVLPSLSKGLFEIGKAWGSVFRAVLDAFSTPEFASALTEILASTQRIIAGLAPVLGRFLTGFIGLISKGLPYVERFAFWIYGLVDAFSAWITKSTESGQVTGWLSQAWEAGKKLWEVFKQLSIFVGLMFGSFGDEGQDTLGGMAESIAKINEYLRSDEGQESLHNLGVIIHWVGNAVVFLIGYLTFAYDLLNRFFAGVRIGKTVLIFLGEAVLWIAKLIIESFTQIPAAVVFLLTSVWQSIVVIFGYIVTFLTDTIPALAVSVGRWFADMWNAAYAAIAGFVTRSLEASGRLRDYIVSHITDMKNRVVSRFNELRDTIIERVRSFVTGARNEAAKLPGQIENAIRSVISGAYNIGRDMIYGMINGVKGAASALWSAAKDVVMGALNSAKNALQSKSPSKKWAELGKDSAAGYQVGFDAYSLTDSIGSAIKMPLDAFSKSNARSAPGNTQVNVGGAQLVAYLQISDDQLQPVVIRTVEENPQTVALASQQGNSQLARRR